MAIKQSAPKVNLPTQKDTVTNKNSAPVVGTQKAPSSTGGTYLDKIKSYFPNGLEIATPPSATAVPKVSTKKPPKSGTFYRTEESQNIPSIEAITANINQIFNQYHGRDARPDELKTYLHDALAAYVDPKTGITKSYVQETYVNGVLKNTKVMTAQKQDVNTVIENKVKDNLAKGIGDLNPSSVPEGKAGAYFVNLKKLAQDNGIQLSDNSAADYANKIAANVIDENTAHSIIRESASSAFPQFADKIKAGVNLKTLADPYVQSMSNILEIPDTTIDLFDPTVRNALSSTGVDGKPVTKSLYEFEQELRKDPRWKYTQNARNSLDSTGLQVLRDFGLAN